MTSGNVGSRSGSGESHPPALEQDESGERDRLPPDLEEALERIAVRPELRDITEGSRAEILDDLQRLAEAVDGKRERTREDEPAQVELDSGGLTGTSARRRLLEILRSTLVSRWSEASDPPGLERMLETLRAIEDVQKRLDPDWASYFARRLREPDGLELVVEVAHDLRSPLTSVLFLSETLRGGRSGPVNELQRRQLGLIYSAALGVITIASDVIELARGGDRLSEKEPSAFSLGETFQSVREMVEPMADEKDVSLRFRKVEVDQRIGYPVPLSRVLLNLTTNALKFTEQGMVEIAAEEKEGRVVELSVRDTGRGIPEESAETLFRPFQQSESSSGSTFSGTGLGLSIARKLVEAMGSELQYETDPDWGTRFYFELELPEAGGG